MINGVINEEIQPRNTLFSRSQCFLKRAVPLALLLSLFLGTNRGTAVDKPLSEYQIKALFLFNFAKYVAWPTDTFANDKTPLVIGVLGENKIGDGLNESVKGKQVNGREIVIRRFEIEHALDTCHILFISVSEKKHLREIFLKTKAVPVLTVGETEQFIHQGGIINFVKKEDKVRLEINADSAAQSKLQISSKLLNVADVVKGRK